MSRLIVQIDHDPRDGTIVGQTTFPTEPESCFAVAPCEGGKLLMAVGHRDALRIVGPCEHIEPKARTTTLRVGQPVERVAVAAHGDRAVVAWLSNRRAYVATTVGGTIQEPVEVAEDAASVALLPARDPLLLVARRQETPTKAVVLEGQARRASRLDQPMPWPDPRGMPAGVDAAGTAWTVGKDGEQLVVSGLSSADSSSVHRVADVGLGAGDVLCAVCCRDDGTLVALWRSTRQEARRNSTVPGTFRALRAALIRDGRSAKLATLSDEASGAFGRTTARAHVVAAACRGSRLWVLTHSSSTSFGEDYGTEAVSASLAVDLLDDDLHATGKPVIAPFIAERAGSVSSMAAFLAREGGIGSLFALVDSEPSFSRPV